jgi:hypothetical protein
LICTKKIEALERRVKVQSLHIQQVKLEADEGGFQSEEKLEEAGDAPAGEWQKLTVRRGS